MFRFVIALLAAFGLGALIFGGNTVSVAGLVLLVPLFFIFKVMLFMMLFGLVSSAIWGRGGRSPRPCWQSHRHHRSRGTGGSTDAASGRAGDETDRFEEWHRMAHAKEEVESWIPDEV
jgi:hypothetical protein